MKKKIKKVYPLPKVSLRCGHAICSCGSSSFWVEPEDIICKDCNSKYIPETIRYKYIGNLDD